MYMNCVSIVVQNMKKKYVSSESVKHVFLSKQADLSDMFVININNCIITERIFIQFSDSNSSVQFADDFSNLMKTDDVICKKTDNFNFIADFESMFFDAAFSTVFFRSASLSTLVSASF